MMQAERLMHKVLCARNDLVTEAPHLCHRHRKPVMHRVRIECA